MVAGATETRWDKVPGYAKHRNVVIFDGWAATGLVEDGLECGRLVDVGTLRCQQKPLLRYSSIAVVSWCVVRGCYRIFCSKVWLY